MASGGKRIGAGRKPSLNKKQRIVAYIRPEVLKEYERLKEVGVTMEDIILHFTGLGEPKEER